jgi:sarcosine oxidase subunit gamma
VTAAVDLRRLPARRWHESQGASFKLLFDCGTPAHYGGEVVSEAASARDLAAIDLSALPRCGFKGRGTVEWLGVQSVAVPETSNKALRQTDGSIVLRCGSTDILIAGDVLGRSNAPWALREVHGRSPGASEIGYDALREEGYAWFMLIGKRTPELLAHVCEVDMRPHAFSDLDIAQTRLAGLSAVLCRADLAGIFAIHAFFDVASSVYFCEAIAELLAATGGRFIGHESILALEHSTTPGGRP